MSVMPTKNTTIATPKSSMAGLLLAFPWYGKAKEPGVKAQ
jgi:hypothetical protein